jgi:hypothetical protein
MFIFVSIFLFKRGLKYYFGTLTADEKSRLVIVEKAVFVVSK